MSANAILQADLGPSGLSGIIAKLFEPDSDTLIATIPASSPTNDWIEQTNRKGVYDATQALGLTGRHFIVFFNSAGNRIASGWVFLTDDTDVHIVVGYASVSNKNGAGGSNLAGPGADEVTLTFQSNGVDPDINARVWITSDQAGTDVLAGTLYTNDNGQVTFMLEDGLTYYLWFVCPGQASIQGQLFTAVKD